MENFRYTESISCYFVITSTSGIFEALVITQAAYNEAILKVLRTSLYLVSTGEREGEKDTERERGAGHPSSLYHDHVKKIQP